MIVCGRDYPTVSNDVVYLHGQELSFPPRDGNAGLTRRKHNHSCTAPNMREDTFCFSGGKEKEKPLSLEGDSLVWITKPVCFNH